MVILDNAVTRIRRRITWLEEAQSARQRYEVIKKLCNLSGAIRMTVAGERRPDPGVLEEIADALDEAVVKIRAQLDKKDMAEYWDEITQQANHIAERSERIRGRALAPVA